MFGKQGTSFVDATHAAHIYNSFKQYLHPDDQILHTDASMMKEMLLQVTLVHGMAWSSAWPSAWHAGNAPSGTNTWS